MSAHFSFIRLRRLLAALTAFALLWGPLAHQTGMAMAAAPADHSMQMMTKGHCEEPSSDSRDKLPAKSCCVAMLAAIEPAAVLSLEPHALPRAPMQVEGTASVASFPAELATPPPRS